MACGLWVALLLGISGNAAAVEQASEDVLQRAAMVMPRNPKAHLDLVQWHLTWNDTDKALATLQNALEVDPGNAWRYHQRRGDVLYEQRHDLNASEASYREALRENPRARRSLLRYGAMRMWKGAADEATALFENAVKWGLLRDPLQRPLDELVAEISSEFGPWIPPANYILLDDAMDSLAHPKVFEVFSKEYATWLSEGGMKKTVESTESDPAAPGRHLQFWIQRPHFVEGVWRDVCAIETPQICQALKSLNGSGLMIIHQASFEILENGARVRPHCHPSNAELFLDIIIKAPAASEKWGTPVYTSAGGETRPWTTGDVSIFDGSFEHMQENKAIGETAVILRLVVRHPHLPCEGDFDACGIKGYVGYFWREFKKMVFGPPEDFGVHDAPKEEL